MAAVVLPYSIDAFAELLEKHSEATGSTIRKKLESDYFKDYFETVGVKTIILEDPYIDHDYLDDFSAYYVKCYHAYQRFCVRLHFFSESFDSASFSAFVQGRLPSLGDVLKGSYCGFLVVRPLPQSVIGRTCLMNYPSDSGRRHFPTGIPCRANLFGLPLSVTTVPFQEQDTVTAACATSALWSAFQITGARLQHWLPSPVEITSAATQQMPLRSRVFPNADGLTIQQMARAIQSVGLEPYYIDPSNPEITRAAVYAYVSSGIPALLTFELTGKRNGTTEHIGYHAVTITGFSVSNTAIGSPYGGTYLRSGRIDKIYAHDDQVGPHARVDFITPVASQYYLTTSWGLGGCHTDIRAIPDSLLFPLYNKVRLPFSVPMADVQRFDDVLQAIARTVSSVPNLEWELRLVTIADLRSDIRENWTAASPEYREKLLTGCLPRFLWLATAWGGLDRKVDILFDATDIDSGNYIRLIKVHDKLIDAILNIILSNSSSKISALLNTVYSKIDESGL